MRYWFHYGNLRSLSGQSNLSRTKNAHRDFYTTFYTSYVYVWVCIKYYKGRRFSVCVCVYVCKRVCVCVCIVSCSRQHKSSVQLLYKRLKWSFTKFNRTYSVNLIKLLTGSTLVRSRFDAPYETAKRVKATTYIRLMRKTDSDGFSNGSPFCTQCVAFSIGDNGRSEDVTLMRH